MTVSLVLLVGTAVIFGGWKIYWREGIWCLVGMCAMAGGCALISLGLVGVVNLYLWRRI